MGMGGGMGVEVGVGVRGVEEVKARGEGGCEGG